MNQATNRGEMVRWLVGCALGKIVECAPTNVELLTALEMATRADGGARTTRILRDAVLERMKPHA